MSTKLATIISDFSTNLATAIIVGGTTATLQSATDSDGIALPSGRYYFTLDRENSSKEHIACQLSGTALTSIVSVSRQGVETTGVVRAHRVGTTVTLTDYAHIKSMNDLLSGATPFDATVPLSYDGTASITLPNQIATKAYADGLAFAGSPDATTGSKGIVKLSVSPVSATSPIVVGDNDLRVPTSAQAAALVGTSGTAPSSSNKFVDAADVSSTAASGKIVRATGTQLPALDGSLLTSITNVVKIVASDNLKLSSDAVVTAPTYASYYSTKTLMSYYSGVCRIKFDAAPGYTGAVTWSYSLKRNGIPVGSSQTIVSPVSTSYVTFSQDLKVGAGDNIELLIETSGNPPASVRNFRMYADISYDSTFGQVVA